MNLSKFSQNPVIKTFLLFIILLCASTLLIMMGRRNDAITQAQFYQSGVLFADDVSVAPQNVGGRVIARYVTESEHVGAGQLLMQLEPDDYEIALKTAVARRDSMRAQVAAYAKSIEVETSKLGTLELNTWRQIERQLAIIDSARANLTEQTANYKRYQSLLSKNAVSQSEYDAAYASYVAALSNLTEAAKTFDVLTLGASDEDIKRVREERNAQGLYLQDIEDQRMQIANMQNTLESYRANLKELEAAVEQAELNLKRTAITAPCAGLVRELMFEEGELISPNTPAVLLETDRLYFDVYVPETHLSDYTAGTQIKVYVPAQNRTVTGTIRYLNPAPSFADLRMTREQGQADLTSFEMRVYVNDPKLVPGMMMEIRHES